MTPTFRPIDVHEQSQAVDLWHMVFGVPHAYFARYYAADPWYQQGDSLGAWVDGAMVSAVHVCRRPLTWEGGTLLCGGIANVATLPDYRKQGLSSRLLSWAIRHMEDGSFDFSTLGTGIPNHYAVLGWEVTRLPHFQITIHEGEAVSDGGLEPAQPTEEIAALYASHPRPLQLQRPGPYFRGWVGWNWETGGALARVMPGEGYLILQCPEAPDRPLAAAEWRADSAAAEEALLREAVTQARAHGRERVTFAALPQYVPLMVLESLGAVERTHSAGHMIRNIRLSEAEFARVVDAYRSGQAAWWPADSF